MRGVLEICALYLTIVQTYGKKIVSVKMSMKMVGRLNDWLNRALILIGNISAINQRGNGYVMVKHAYCKNR